MCHQDNLFRPGTDELLHFSMAYKISVLEKVFHEDVSLVGISFNRLTSTCWYWAELKELYRVLYKSDNLIQGQLLYRITLIAGSFLYLTQFMSSQGPSFLTVLSILLSKNLCLVLLTVSLNIFQSSRYLNCRYLLRSLLQSLFHQALDYFMMLTFLECLNHILSML